MKKFAAADRAHALPEWSRATQMTTLLFCLAVLSILCVNPATAAGDEKDADSIQIVDSSQGCFHDAKIITHYDRVGDQYKSSLKSIPAETISRLRALIDKSEQGPHELKLSDFGISQASYLQHRDEEVKVCSGNEYKGYSDLPEKLKPLFAFDNVSKMAAQRFVENDLTTTADSFELVLSGNPQVRLSSAHSCPLLLPWTVSVSGRQWKTYSPAISALVKDLAGANGPNAPALALADYWPNGFFADSQFWCSKLQDAINTAKGEQLIGQLAGFKEISPSFTIVSSKWFAGRLAVELRPKTKSIIDRVRWQVSYPDGKTPQSNWNSMDKQFADCQKVANVIKWLPIWKDSGGRRLLGCDIIGGSCFDYSAKQDANDHWKSAKLPGEPTCQLTLSAADSSFGKLVTAAPYSQFVVFGLSSVRGSHALDKLNIGYTGYALMDDKGAILASKTSPSSLSGNASNPQSSKQHKSSRLGLIGADGRLAVAPQFAALGNVSEELIAAKKEDGTAFGYIDLHGKFVIPPRFTAAGTFSQGLAPVSVGSKCGYIDKSGKIVIDCRFDQATSFSENLAAVRMNDKWGFIDKSAKQVIPCKFAVAAPFSDGLSLVQLDGKFAFVDRSGKLIGNQFFDDLGPFKEGLAVAKNEHLYGFIDKTGAWIIPAQFQSAGPFINGLAAAWKDHKSCFVDKSGKISYTMPTDESRSDELIKTVAGRNSGFYNHKGELVVHFDQSSAFSEGLVYIKDGNQCGFIDKKGKFVIPLRQGELGTYCKDGLVRFEKDGKWGYLDRTGEIAIAPQFEQATDFSHGLGVVTVDGKLGAVDKSGKFVVEPKYHQIFVKDANVVEVEAQGKHGFLDAQGRVLTERIFDSTSPHGEGYVLGEVFD